MFPGKQRNSFWPEVSSRDLQERSKKYVHFKHFTTFKSVKKNNYLFNRFFYWVQRTAWCAWWEAMAPEKRSRSSSARLRRPLRAFCSVANIWSNPASSTTTRTSTYPGSGTWTSAKTGIKNVSVLLPFFTLHILWAQPCKSGCSVFSASPPPPLLLLYFSS